jgi:hypothetical protein
LDFHFRDGTLWKAFAPGELYSAAAGHNIGLDWLEFIDLIF